MPRVKRGTVRTRKRRALLSQTKGYHWGRKNLTKLAKTAVKKAGVYAFRDRRNKKRTARALWQVRLNAALRPLGLKYSLFIDLLKKNKIALDRKVLVELAIKQPEIFVKIVNQIKK
ncbi:MAG TPA: 50S ribosomal protein L20 [bacterium]|nr:50S ribosomal protein L20 [bacterium]HPL95562.1 50S ribosomal protein L20 [bacterium]